MAPCPSCFPFSRRHLVMLKAGVSSVTALVQEGVGSVEGTDGSQSEKEDSGMGL